MKTVTIATLLTAAISAPSFAASSNELSDASQIFNMDNSQPMELAMLPPKEMKSTEGAWFQYAIGGGVGFVTGNYSYLTNAAFDPNFTWSWSSYVRSVGASTVVGAINPVSSVSGVARAGVSSFIAAWQFR